MGDPLNIGKVIFFTGGVICIIGLIVMLGSKFNLFNLPGDISLSGKNWSLFIPIGSCIVISAILTIIFWLINRFK